MPAFEWVHVQLHQQKGMISLSPPTICNSALSSAFTRTKGGEAPPLIRPPEISPRQAEGRASLTGPKSPARASAAMTAAALSRVDDGSGGYRQPLAQPRHRGRTASDLEATGPSHPDMDLDARTDVRFRVLGVLR
ncbi:putative transposase [Acinetobacter baumannii 10519]|nr:putative transposase [Acinetobacter baumannii 10519]